MLVFFHLPWHAFTTNLQQISQKRHNMLLRLVCQLIYGFLSRICQNSHFFVCLKSTGVSKVSVIRNIYVFLIVSVSWQGQNGPWRPLKLIPLQPSWSLNSFFLVCACLVCMYGVSPTWNATIIHSKDSFNCDSTLEATKQQTHLLTPRSASSVLTHTHLCEMWSSVSANTCPLKTHTPSPLRRRLNFPAHWKGWHTFAIGRKWLSPGRVRGERWCRVIVKWHPDLIPAHISLGAAD